MSIANRKFTDMKQIEFQQSGSSRVEVMLTQPLLEKASTYMCEVTDLQATIGEELAFPENQWMFSIIQKPLIPPGTDLEFFFSPHALENYMLQLHNGNLETPASHIFGVPHKDQPFFVEPRWRGGYCFDNDLDDVVAFPPEIPTGEHKVFSGRYYSVLDLSLIHI